MERMTLGRLVMTAVAVLALALAGCGGDDGVDQSVHDMVTAERDAAQAAADKAAADAAVAVAAAQAAAETAATEAAAAVTAAQAALARAETAQAAAEAARDEARTGEMEAETRADKAETAATEAAAAAKAAADIATQAAADLKQAQEDLAAAIAAQMMAEGDLGDAQDTIDANAADAMQADMNTRAPSITAAMTGFYIEPDTDVNPPIVGGYMTPEEAPTGLSLSHSADSGITVTPLGPPLQYEEYMVAEDGPPMIHKWDGITLTRRTSDDAATQSVYAYTDIATAGMKPFGTEYGLMVTFDSTGTTASLAGAASSEFPTAPGDAGAQQYAANDVAFVGTYAGVTGTFDCGGEDACTVTRHPDTHALSVTVGSLVFTPDDATDMVTIADPDGYLYFGFWLEKPDNAQGMHRFATFASGATAFDNTTIAPIIGRATYEGPAAGKYITRDIANNEATIGIFTATAEMLADFAVAADGTRTAAGTNVGTLQGTIGDFMDGDESLGNWLITLDPATMSITAATPTMGSTTARIGAYSTPTDMTEGHWESNFFGVHDNGDPASVAGRFDVHNDHATISGAFGAYHAGE